jgi:hypothetical protein
MMSDYATSEDARKDGNKLFLEREFLKGTFESLLSL